MEIGSRGWKKIIIHGARDIGVHVTAANVDQFSVYALELLRWNKTTNITAIKNPLDVAVKHFIDSIAPVNIIPEGASLLDIGAGGGFPGIPLKIVKPTLKVTLIDGSRKKISFMKHVIRCLRLIDIDAFQVRAEDWIDYSHQKGLIGEKTHPYDFDVVISRGLTSLNRFVRMARPLLAKHGRIIALKGKHLSADNLVEDVEPTKDEKHSKGKPALEITRFVLPYVGEERSIAVLTC
jgi:16S rRNA (guanine527-N7)-methyltransferase